MSSAEMYRHSKWSLSIPANPVDHLSVYIESSVHPSPNKSAFHVIRQPSGELVVTSRVCLPKIGSRHSETLVVVVGRRDPFFLEPLIRNCREPQESPSCFSPQPPLLPPWDQQGRLGSSLSMFLWASDTLFLAFDTKNGVESKGSRVDRKRCSRSSNPRPDTLPLESSVNGQAW